MIESYTPGVIRVIQKFISESEYLNSFDTPIRLVAAIPGGVIQALSCTVQCNPDQSTPYDRIPAVWSTDPTSPQLILIDSQLLGYSIFSQTVNGASFGNTLGDGVSLNFSAIDSNPGSGDSGMWVSLTYIVWPDKTKSF